jgi:hypothetical protein
MSSILFFQSTYYVYDSLTVKIVTDQLAELGFKAVVTPEELIISKK